MNKSYMKKKIFELDFAIHELVLYLDSHPTCKKGLGLLKEFREKRAEAVAAYEEKYGPFIVTADDAPTDSCWRWLDSPWPWENNFLEE